MMGIMNGAAAFRRFIHAVAGKLSWLPPTLTRVTVGWVFMQSGWGKLTHLPDIIKYFGELGIPMPEFQAPFAASAELVCGTLILAGLFTRLASVPLIIVMIVAIITARKGDYEGVASLFGFIEYLYIVLFLWLGVAGAGPLSLDRLLAPRLESRRS
jgi:putative oxidoreductase